MNLLHAILLGLVQGLTEFLPVSSTAHLTLAENLLMGRSMPLAFDVLLHVGTLAALAVYFRKDLRKVLRGLVGRDAEGRKLAWWLFLAMIPTGVFALGTRHWKAMAKDGHLWVYGVFLLLTAWMLHAANERGKAGAGKNLDAMTGMDALAIGAIQGLGGGFGLSRSGSTLSMGVFRGLKLPDSTRFSFLLGIPTIAAAALVEGRKIVLPLMKGQSLPQDLAFPPGTAHPALLCAVGVLVAAVSGYGAIGLLDQLTRKPRLGGFAFYCLCMGALMLILGTVGPDGFFFLSGVTRR